MNQANPLTKTNTLLWTITLVVVFISLILVLLRVDTSMQNKAIDECGKISIYSQTLDNNIKVTYPVQDIYNACLKKKGL